MLKKTDNTETQPKKDTEILKAQKAMESLKTRIENLEQYKRNTEGNNTKIKALENKLDKLKNNAGNKGIETLKEKFKTLETKIMTAEKFRKQLLIIKYSKDPSAQDASTIQDWLTIYSENHMVELTGEEPYLSLVYMPDRLDINDPNKPSISNWSKAVKIYLQKNDNLLFNPKVLSQLKLLSVSNTSGETIWQHTDDNKKIITITIQVSRGS